jgi:hypothetical protein
VRTAIVIMTFECKTGSCQVRESVGSEEKQEYWEVKRFKVFTYVHTHKHRHTYLYVHIYIYEVSIMTSTKQFRKRNEEGDR